MTFIIQILLLNIFNKNDFIISLVILVTLSSFIDNYMSFKRCINIYIYINGMKE